MLTEFHQIASAGTQAVKLRSADELLYLTSVIARTAEAEVLMPAGVHALVLQAEWRYAGRRQSKYTRATTIRFSCYDEEQADNFACNRRSRT